MKNLCKLLMVLFLSITMSGCGSAETKEHIEENAKDIFKKTFELYRTYNGYQVNVHRKITSLFSHNNKLAITPVEEIKYTVKEVKEGNAYYEVVNMASHTNETLHQCDYEVYIKKPDYYHKAKYDKTDNQNIRLTDVGINEISNKNEALVNPFLNYIYDYYLKDYKNFFDFKKEISGDKIIVKITCNDVKGFSDYIINEKIQKNLTFPEFAYDPYVIDGIKVSKNETVRECTLTLDGNYNIIKIEDLTKQDYGDGLTTTDVVILEIDQINKLDMNTEAIESLLKKAETAIIGDGTFTSLEMKNDIDWDFQ